MRHFPYPAHRFRKLLAEFTESLLCDEHRLLGIEHSPGLHGPDQSGTDGLRGDRCLYLGPAYGDFRHPRMAWDALRCGHGGGSAASCWAFPV